MLSLDQCTRSSTFLTTFQYLSPSVLACATCGLPKNTSFLTLNPDFSASSACLSMTIRGTKGSTSLYIYTLCVSLTLPRLSLRRPDHSTNGSGHRSRSIRMSTERLMSCANGQTRNLPSLVGKPASTAATAEAWWYLIEGPESKMVVCVGRVGELESARA